MGNAHTTPGGPPKEALAVVPARLASTRLPRKMLLRESGAYLFQHTVENVRRCGALERVVLATDSDEIARAADGVGIEVVRTSSAHPSGSDRVHEAHAILLERGEGPWPVVVNVQGDEPELPAGDLVALVDAFSDPSVEIATLATPLDDPDEIADPGVVKVVVDRRGDALYFSRAPLPALHAAAEAVDGPRSHRHLGVYAFRPAALTRFCTLPRGRLEALEGLEQLRWLEAGLRLRVVRADHVGRPGIDTRDHYEAFLRRLARNHPLQGTRSP